ncbi:MAG: DUF1778 domain-containing protein [Planctomycetota bacterium]
MAARGMGRPPHPEGEALSERITARVRPTEKAEIQAAAEASGTTMAEWLREVALSAARRRIKRKTARRRKGSKPV